MGCLKLCEGWVFLRGGEKHPLFPRKPREKNRSRFAPAEMDGGWNLYAMVGNDPVGRWDYGGLLLSSRPIIFLFFQQQQRKRAKKERQLYILKIKSRGSKNPPSCNKTKDCKKITVLIELGHSYDSYVQRKVGHTGVAVEDEFYDYGPEGGANVFEEKPRTQWWDDPEDFPGVDDPADVDLPGIENAINNKKIADTYDVIKIQWCVCKNTADKIENYWKKLYKDMKLPEGNSDKPIYCMPGLHCTSAACPSIKGVKRNSSFGRLLSPEHFLSQLVGDGLYSIEKNQCGLDKNKPAYIEHLNREK